MVSHGIANTSHGVLGVSSVLIRRQIYMKSTRKKDTVHTWHRVEANRGWRRPVGLVGTKQTPTRHPQPRSLIRNCEALVGVKLGLRAHGITNAIILISLNTPMVRQCVCRQRVRQQQISRCPVRIIEHPVRMIEHPYTWSLICSQVRLGTVHQWS